MTVRWATTTTLILVAAAGCSRDHYRRSADAEAYSILREKSASRSWELPAEFTIQKDPRSRLADPPVLDCPPLPNPNPRLFAYELPPTRRSATAQQQKSDGPMNAVMPLANGQIQGDRVVLAAAGVLRPLPLPSPTLPQPQVGQSASARRSEIEQLLMSGVDQATGLPLRPVPENAWREVPSAYLVRMLEFESIRREYQDSFSAIPPVELRDQSRRLTLDEIVELAFLNSREFQSQKETLYREALALTLERFDYELKFSPVGNGTAADYSHARAAGKTVNTLGVPSRLQTDKLLATGGDFLARFANDVVLTFGGPKGFTSDVSSELLFKLTQPLIQRDIRLEPLIQSERNVVYAARSFARFRKQFFVDRASEYYVLLRAYRQVEIEAQNYFSLVRALNQAEAEARFGGERSRIEVEQIEQNMLQGRSRLITTCNALETGLDRLKLAMGLPTETAINLDLTELEQFTLLDEIQVKGERVVRARRELLSYRQESQPDRNQLLNSAVVLSERLVELLSLRQGATDDTPGLRRAKDSYFRLHTDDARLTANLGREELQKVRETEKPNGVRTMLRSMDAVVASIRLLHRQRELAEWLRADEAAITAMRQATSQLQDRATKLRERLDVSVNEAQFEQRREELLRDSSQLLDDTDAQITAGDRLVGEPAERPNPEDALKRTVEQVDQLLDASEKQLREIGVGLVPVEITFEDALLTSLAERLDLMNERGRVADDRRAVKLAADDLKSALNLNAEQRIRTRKNRPFGFTLDESETRLALTLDLPLNRKSQRNSYRETLIDYQAGLRRLMDREDTIKFGVREELRSLSQARGQYLISVAGAALGAERVQSTRLVLALGFPGVAARDFLEAQDAYTRAFSAVADNRITHIRQRMQLFLDLELLLLDPSGFWPQLNDDQHQPTPRRELAPDGSPPFGEIPGFLKVSDEIKATAAPLP